MSVMYVSANYFRTLGVSVALGRAFLPEEDEPGADPPIVISDQLWRGRLGADAHIVGRALSLDRTTYRIVGGAHTIVLVVAHERAGQRDLSMAPVRERITATLRGRKEQLLRAAYLTAARSDANVVNYLARRLVESQGKMPSLVPAPRGGS